MNGKPPIHPSWNIPVACAIGAIAGFYGIGGLFIRTGGSSGFLPVLSCLFLVSSLGTVVLSLRKTAWIRSGLFLIILAGSGLFFSTKRIEYNLALTGASAGQPLSGITGFRGFCLDDSMRTSTGKNFVRIRLMETFGRNALLTSASGTVAVLYDGNFRTVFPWGRIYTVRAPLLSPEQAGDDFFAFSDESSITATGWYHGIFKIRASGKESIKELIDKIDSGSLLSALFLGDKDRLSPEVYENFKKSGSVHILALSGMHLGLIAALLSFVLSPLLGRRNSFRVILIVLVWYLFLAGPKPSLLRSALMMAVAWIYSELRRSVEPIVIPSLAFVIYLMLDPSAAFTLAFQLSFLAVAGIILWGPFLTARIMRYMPRPVAGALSASLAAQAFTVPVVVPTFGTFYPIGIFAGLLLGPLTTIFLWVGIAGLFLSVCMPFSTVLVTPLLDFLSQLTMLTVSICAGFPFLDFR